MNRRPKIFSRPCNDHVLAAASQLNLSPVVQRVLANRASKHDLDPASLINCPLRELDSPNTLPDIFVGAERLVRAILQGEVIGLETDHDVDGVTSHAVLHQALTQYFGHPADKIRSYIGHRLNEGYGLSDSLCDRILADPVPPSLIITADNGSSDGPRISRLLSAGIDTVVTDHHGIPKEGVPADAAACISPARKDSQYPDPLIAGVMVSFLLMCVVNQRLIKEGVLPSNSGSLSGLLDFVALGTVADCVSLSRSRNNRAVTLAGLGLINANTRPCWQALRPHLGEAEALTSTDLAFGIGPRLNALGRLDDAMVGVNFLLAPTVADAELLIADLNSGNGLRKQIENELKLEAMEVAASQVDSGYKGILVYLTNGHAGVHGIVASRLVEHFGHPALCFSDKENEPGVITGSARGIEGVNVLNALESVHNQQPELLIKFGGHEGAGGLSLKKDDLSAFSALYEQAIAQQIGCRELKPAIMTDGLIATSDISKELIEELKVLEPYGREFESPMFSGVFKIMSANPMGAEKNHWKFKCIGAEGGVFDAVWFNIGTDNPLSMSGLFEIAFTPSLNWWRGKSTLQLIVRGAQETNHEGGIPYA